MLNDGSPTYVKTPLYSLSFLISVLFLFRYLFFFSIRFHAEHAHVRSSEGSQKRSPFFPPTKRASFSGCHYKDPTWFLLNDPWISHPPSPVRSCSAAGSLLSRIGIFSEPPQCVSPPLTPHSPFPSQDGFSRRPALTLLR